MCFRTCFATERTAPDGTTMSTMSEPLTASDMSCIACTDAGRGASETYRSFRLFWLMSAMACSLRPQIFTFVPSSPRIAAKAVPHEPIPMTVGRSKGLAWDGTGPAPKDWCIMISSLEGWWRYVRTNCGSTRSAVCVCAHRTNMPKRYLATLVSQCCDAENLIKSWKARGFAQYLGYLN